MNRVRVSTTVDATRLTRARRLLPGKDSHLIDEALAALIERELARHEVDAIEAAPYDDDPDLNWQAPDGPDLPYDGRIPADVRRLAARRRRK